MSRNGSGTYTLPSGNPVVSGTLIEASWANTTLSDLASAMTDSLSRSGQGGMTAALRLFDGTSSVPGLAWGSETTTGWYRAGAGDMRLVVTGSEIMRYQATGVAVTGTLSSTGNASVGGTLAVTGASTFTGALTANGGVVGNVTGNVSGNAGTVTNGVYTVGDQTIGGTKRFSSSIAVGSNAPVVNLDVQTTGANNLSSLFTTGIDDLNFRAGFMNGVAGSTGSLQARMGLFYLGSGEVATIGMYRGASETDGALTLRTAGSDRVYVASSGNVGIGTSSPSQLLHVVGGNARIDGNYETNVSPYLYSWAGGSTGQVRSGVHLDGTNSLLAFFTAQGERARIDSSGRFQLATTALNGGVFNIGGYVDGGLVAIQLRPTGNNSTPLAFQNAAGAGIGSINATSTGVTYNTASDYRLKENIQPMTGALAKVQQLKPVTYKWKVDGSVGEGFIAHELQEVCPSAVAGEKDAVDAEGTPKYQGIDTSFLVATLTAAIQEQQAIIEQLRADVAALKAA